LTRSILVKSPLSSPSANSSAVASINSGNFVPCPLANGTSSTTALTKNHVETIAARIERSECRPRARGMVFFLYPVCHLPSLAHIRGPGDKRAVMTLLPGQSQCSTACTRSPLHRVTRYLPDPPWCCRPIPCTYMSVAGAYVLYDSLCPAVVVVAACSRLYREGGQAVVAAGRYRYPGIEFLDDGKMVLCGDRRGLRDSRFGMWECQFLLCSHAISVPD
jgi:hypothetical protein